MTMVATLSKTEVTAIVIEFPGEQPLESVSVIPRPVEEGQWDVTTLPPAMGPLSHAQRRRLRRRSRARRY